MIKNFIKIASRGLKKRILFTLINVIGLAIGLGSSFVIGNWVWQELNYDKQFEGHSRIYRISVSYFNSDIFARGPEALVNELRSNSTELNQVAPLFSWFDDQLEVNGNNFKEDVYFSDSSFFDLFSFDFIHGNSKTSFLKSNSVILTKSLAIKYFGIDSVIGREIKLHSTDKTYYITGVVNDEPNSHFASKIWFYKEVSNNIKWTSANPFIYVKLKKDHYLSDLENRLELIKKHIVYPFFQDNIPYSKWQTNYSFHILPLTDIHLAPAMKFEMKAGGNLSNVRIFTFVSILLIVIASINYINLSTAQSIRRSKEICIRKTLGTSRYGIVKQFLTESFLTSTFSMVIGFFLAVLFSLMLEAYTGEKLNSGLFNNVFQILIYVLLSLLVGVLTGVYPALYMSKLNLALILKNSDQGRGDRLFQNILVVVQFAVSVSLIIGSLVVYKQLNHLKNGDLGINQNGVIVIENLNQLGSKTDDFINRLNNNSSIQLTTKHTRVPGDKSSLISTFKSNEMEIDEPFEIFEADENFIEVFGLHLQKGRNFNSDIKSDSLSVILNESAVRAMSLSNPLGTNLKEGYHVVGVVSDFVFQSFYDEPQPVVLMYNTQGRSLSARFITNPKHVIDQLSSAWSIYGIAEQLEFEFLEERFGQLLSKEKSLSKTLIFFTVISILISCMGLFGLAAYFVHERKGEIGIRKTFGASTSDIVLLFLIIFLKMIFIAICIGIVLSVYTMNQWLQSFEYRVSIDFGLVILSSTTILIAAIITVAYTSYKGGCINPIEAIRHH
ncbi:ABC transporter permease [Fulvivirga lutea]|uniref:ABC transporter permease n=1 Tax=Fulvivirga lutea TaxID=2810512 RepID=A0A974WNE9_9BACT|nr:ABC transporter permease [Fulvivirga lutea]QSE98688.1 ABC transporter permease [Fulvivirga lutea]